MVPSVSEGATGRPARARGAGSVDGGAVPRWGSRGRDAHCGVVLGGEPERPARALGSHATRTLSPSELPAAGRVPRRPDPSASLQRCGVWLQSLLVVASLLLALCWRPRVASA